MLNDRDQSAADIILEFLTRGEHYKLCEIGKHSFDALKNKLQNANLTKLGLSTEELDRAISFFDPDFDPSAAGRLECSCDRPNKEFFYSISQKLQEEKNIMKNAGEQQRDVQPPTR